MPLIYAASSYANASEYARADSLYAVLRSRVQRLNPYLELIVAYAETNLAGDGRRALEMARQANALAPGGRRTGFFSITRST